jgi:acyl-CoA reductase-like NAD-dependent aldehyde dehydrogenase
LSTLKYREYINIIYTYAEQQPGVTAQFGEGYFIAPHIFVDVPTTSKLWREEIFGPVLCIRVSTDGYIMICTALYLTFSPISLGI